MRYQAVCYKTNTLIAEGSSYKECSDKAFAVMPYGVGVAPYYIVFGN